MSRFGSAGKGKTGFGLKIRMTHPDFSRAKFDRSKTQRIRVKVAKHILSSIIHRIPIDTGELRESYRRRTNLGIIGPGDEPRKRITNKILAEILSSRGHLHLIIPTPVLNAAKQIAKKEAFGGNGPIKFSGARITLT